MNHLENIPPKPFPMHPVQNSALYVRRKGKLDEVSHYSKILNISKEASTSQQQKEPKLSDFIDILMSENHQNNIKTNVQDKFR